LAAAAAKPSAGPGTTSYAKLVQLRKAGPTDPLAQTPTADINATVNNAYGRPLTDPQISARANDELGPILEAAAAAITGQAGRASSAITLNSGQLAKDLAAENFGSHYDTAKQEQAAVDASLQQSLGDRGGTGLAQDLSTRLGQIEDPAVAALAGSTASRGAAIGTNELAHGSANLSNLIAEAAAAKTYGAKQPGIARFAGLQDLAGVQTHALDDIANSKTSILDKLPDVVNTLRSSNDSLRGSRAQLYATLTGQNISKAVAEAGLGKAADSAIAKITTDSAKAARPDPSLSRAVGYQVDSNGNPIGGTVTPLPGYTIDAKTGNVVKAPKTGTAKPLSGADRRALQSDLTTWTVGDQAKQHYDAAKGWIPVPGTGSKPLPYAQVVQNLITGYGMSEQQAEKLVNTKYQPGQYGRPYPVAPPAGTHPLSPSEVVDGRGAVYKLIGGKWVGETSKAKDFPPAGG
jgi:hypothetical protein